MATNEQALAAVFSEGKTLSVNDSGTWRDLPGLLDFTESGGERTGRTAGTDSTSPTGVVSNRQAPTVEASFKYVSSPNWDVVDSAFESKATLDFRFETEGEEIVGTATTVSGAITTAGALTITGSGLASLDADDFPLGADVVIGGTHYPIVSVGSGAIATAVTVTAPTAAVTAAAMTVVTPAERVSFRGKVLMVPTRQHNIAQQSEREGTLTIQCRKPLPKPVRIT